jgi:hypothetical protein
MFRNLGRIVLIVAALALWNTLPSQAQDAPASYIVQIRTGACDDPGDGIAELEELTIAGANPVGATGAAAAGSSYSVAPVSLESLTGTDTAVFILDGETKMLVACGEIGGAIGSDGALAIGLRPAGDSGLSGIAYLAPNAANPAQTGISTFLALTGATSGGGSGPAATTMDAESYSSMIGSQLTVLVGSLQRIDVLFNNAQPGERSWLSEVGAELFLWKLLYQIAQDVNPPAELESFDGQYLEALALLDSAASDITQALESSDESLLASAVTKIQDAVTVLQNLQSEQESEPPDTATPTS